MKKIYVSPALMLVDVKIGRLLTSSETTLPVNGGNKPEDETVDNPDDLLSRRRSNNVWDDDEDEQYKNQGYGW